MTWNGFDSLDLSGVEASAGSSRLPPGSYNVVVESAQMAGEGQKRMVQVKLVDENGAGDITTNFNVANPSAEAVRIGLSQLKGFLISAGHPNPDKPGDITSLKGLKCSIVVGMGKPWTNRDGKKVRTSEIKKFGEAGSPVSGPTPGAMAYEEVGSGNVTNIASRLATGGGLDDEIPFAPEWRV